MLNEHRLTAFIATNDSGPSRKFYAEVLGLELIEDSQFALVFDAHGTTLRIQKTRGHTPAPHTALGWEVPAIVETVRGLAGRGVKFERFPGMDQDELGIWLAPGSGARVAWFKDSDGNLLSVSQGS